MREEGVVAYPSSRYRDVNPVPTSPFADDIATAPSRPVMKLPLYLVISF